MPIEQFLCDSCGQPCIWFVKKQVVYPKEGKHCAECIRANINGELAEIRRAKELSGAPSE